MDVKLGVRFAFENAGKGYFGTIYRPVAKVSLKSVKQGTWINIWMVVDSGADFTLLPRYLHQDLGISLEYDCIKDKTIGIGGEQTIYLCKLRIKTKVSHIKRTIPLAFLDSNKAPALLGRLGFLETLDTYLLKTHYVIFKD